MFDNMTGAVGFAMHEERLARVARNLRIVEATGATKRRGLVGNASGCRTTMARVLRALVSRVAVGADTRTVASAR